MRPSTLSTLVALLLSCLVAACASSELRESEESDSGEPGSEDAGLVRDIGPQRDLGGFDTTMPDTGGEDAVGSDGGEDAAGDTGDEDTSDECLPPWFQCGVDCVDVQSNIDHCGGCFLACLPGQVCSEGVCAEGCGAGLVSCGGDCVDAQTSSVHCGSCDNACRADQACVGGVCTLSCGAGQTECGGACVDTMSDRTNCGGCGVECPSDRTCSDGRCACPGSLVECNGRCVDTTEDADNCGVCGTACDENEQCSSGSCICESGLFRCDGACVALELDPTNCGVCGNACTEAEICVDGICESDCADDQIVCDRECIDPVTSEAHCGRCGNTCPTGQFCTDGSCACPDDLAICSGECRDLDVDPDACGACSTSCRDDQSCTGGACVCPGELGECGGACIPYDNDPMNCGGCGVACNDSELCREGACVCTVGTLDCGDGCIDVLNDTDNCGACGTRCGDGLFCIDGECVDECPLGQTRCDGVCVDTGTDENNCGACGTACSDLETCEAGMCECGNDHLEPNDTTELATVVARGDTATEARRGSQLNDLILCEDEVDSYRVVAPGSQSLIEIDMLGDCELASTGVVLQLNAPDGTSFASSSSGGAGSCPALSYRTPEFGLHELQVRGGEGVRYSLDIRVSDVGELTPGTRQESNAEATGPISRTSSFFGDIDHDDGFFTFTEDIDLFFVQFIEHTNVVIESRDRDSGCSFDGTLELVNEAGDRVAFDDDGGAGLCSRIEQSVPPGNYYIRMRAYDTADEFDYAIDVTTSVRQEQEPNDVADFANDVGSGSFGVEGAIQQAFDVDLYAFSLDLTSDVTVYTAGIGIGCPTDTMVAIYEVGADTALIENDDAEGTLCSRIETTLSAGDYLLEVRGYAATRGDYLVNLTVE